MALEDIENLNQIIFHDNITDIGEGAFLSGSKEWWPSSKSDMMLSPRIVKGGFQESGMKIALMPPKFQVLEHWDQWRSFDWRLSKTPSPLAILLWS